MRSDRRTPPWVVWVVFGLPLVALLAVFSAHRARRRARLRLFKSVNPVCTMCTSSAVQYYSSDDWFPVANSEVEAMSMMAAMDGTTNFTTMAAREDQYRHFKDHGVLSAEYNPFRYVQGLKKDDAPDLVVMYVKEMTHWPTKRFFNYEETPKWVVMGPQVTSYWAYEGGWVDTREFTRRLRKTLDFLRANERPHWQETVKEHGRFLQQVRGRGKGSRKHGVGPTTPLHTDRESAALLPGR